MSDWQIEPIAIVGLGVRVAGATTVAGLRQLIEDGRTAIADLPDRGDGRVPRRAELADADRFDADTFGVLPGDAALLDRQQRVLLEVVWHALEDAAVVPGRAGERVSVYLTSTPISTGEPQRAAEVAAHYRAMLLGSSQFAATRVAYVLGLRGEAIQVETGCSSSLVAVHLACESLRARHSDLAVAGGASIPLDQELGYWFEPGMVTSPSGECRPFDARASGAVPGSGAGIVVLQPLSDALRAGRRIHAVVLGTAVNNDGRGKAGFMAPSAEGQAEVIAEAIAASGFTGRDIGLVETHGTATAMGDAVEIEGLRRAFRSTAAGRGFCALGAAKASVGHLDRASGVVGLIAAAQAIEHGVLPPIAGFERAGEKLELDQSPFFVAPRATPWPAGRRSAGVSSFGVGGTNCHVVLSEAPRAAEPARPAADPELVTEIVPLSAASAAQLADLSRAVASAVEGADPAAFARTAQTLRTGRRPMRFRAAVVAGSGRGAADALGRITPEAPRTPRGAVLAVPGQGSPVVDGSRWLYERDTVYRREIDRLSEGLLALGAVDPRPWIFDRSAPEADRRARFEDFRLCQVAHFAHFLSLVRQWLALGVEPLALIGHSVGEIVVACAAEAISDQDALRLIVARGQAMQECPPGAMLQLEATRAEAEGWITRIAPDDLGVSVQNAARLTVVSGSPAAVDRLAAALAAKGVAARRLAITRAAHTRHMETAARRLDDVTRSWTMRPPRIRYPSNLDGAWMAGAPPTGYWGRHLTSPVEFEASLARLDELGDDCVLVDLSARGAIGFLAEASLPARRWRIAADTEAGAGRDAFLATAAESWALGLPVDLAAVPFSPPEAPVGDAPLYLFDHGRLWPRPAASSTGGAPGACDQTQAVDRDDDPATWLHQPVWVKARPATAPAFRRCVLLSGSTEAGRALTPYLCELGLEVEQPDLADDLDLTGETLVVDLGAVSEPGETGSGTVTWFRSLARALRRAGRATVVSVLAHRPGELDLRAAWAEAAAVTTPLEQPSLSWSILEVADPLPSLRLARAILQATTTRRTRERGDGLEALELRRAWPAARCLPLRPGGLYLITGGAGQVGRSLAAGLGARVPAHIALVGRTPAAEVAPSLEPLRAQLAGTGSTVSYHEVDVARPGALAAACRILEVEHGPVRGFIHAAGDTRRSGFRFLDDEDEQHASEVVAAKIEGALAIEELVSPDTDLVVLCSSLSTVLGGVRFAAYVAANRALERLAERRWAMGDHRFVAIAWDAWRPVDHAAADPDHLALDRLALGPDDGWEVFSRALASRGPILINSTVDVESRSRAVSRALDGAPDREQPVEPETTAMIDIVRRVAEQVLGGTIASTRRLAELGADSLLLLQIVARLRATTRRPLSIADAMRAGTVEGIARALESGAPETAAGSEIAVAPQAESYPTSSIQRRWLELEQHGYGGISMAVEFEPPVDAARLRDAFTQVLERHGGLRTGFRRDAGGAWRQIVKPATPATLVDRKSLGRVEASAAAAEILHAAARRWFSFDDPPLRAWIVATGTGHAILLLHAHHVLLDGWSSSILLQDVERAYGGQLPSDRAPQYIDYALVAERRRERGELAGSLDYWRRHFAGVDGPTRLPAAAPDAGRGASMGRRLGYRIDPDLSRGLRATAASLGITPFAMFTGAFSLMVARVAQTSRPVIGTTSANRRDVTSERIAGAFVNPLPLAISVGGGETPRRYLEEVARTLVEYHEHADCTLEDLVAGVEPFVGKGLNDCFHCYLLYQSYWRAERDASILRYHRSPLVATPQHRVMREFEVVVDDDADGALELEVWYDEGRFGEAAVRGWAQGFLALLAGLEAAGDQTRPVAALAEEWWPR
jgi:phthiocerol/phenolphthiocerol synthesis type-I polyketide synthase E